MEFCGYVWINKRSLDIKRYNRQESVKSLYFQHTKIVGGVFSHMDETLGVPWFSVLVF
mgnify:CR=1 FL=1